MGLAYEVVELTRWHIMVTSASQNTPRPPDISAPRSRPSLERTCVFTAHHLCWSAPLRTPPLPSQDSLRGLCTLWLCLRLQHQLPNQPCPGLSPLKGARVSMPPLYSLCTHSVNPPPPPPRGHRETTNMWAAAEQRDVFTFHPELQLDLWQKQKYCNVYFFFPRNDNYSYPNIFQTSTTKMEKAFQKIIYEIGTYILGSPYMEMPFFFFLPCH